MTTLSALPSPILSKTVIVTAAQLKANMVTGVPIVPAPGVGKVIVPVAALSQMKFGSVAFNFATDLSIGDLLGNLVWIDFGAATFLNQAQNMLSYFNVPEYGGAGGKEVAQVHFDNIGLFLFGPNNATLGDGELVITFFYAVVSMQ
jgi:hypothetical protein